MATLADKRAWLRDNTTEDIPARGRLRPDLLSLYDQAHPDTPADPRDAEWDLDEGLAEELDDIIDLDLEPPVKMQPERPPRTVKAARAEKRAQPVTTRASSWLGKLLGEDKKKTAAKKGKPIPRTSLEKLISDAYAEAGKLAATLSRPMSRCLQAQAAFAGIVWEDVLRGTIIDKALQPAARAEEKLSKGFALMAPPIAVLAAERNQVMLAQNLITPNQFMVRQALTMPVLRQGLRKQLQVSRQYADQIREKIEQDAADDAEVDALLALIFEPVQAEAEPEMAGAAA